MPTWSERTAGEERPMGAGGGVQGRGSHREVDLAAAHHVVQEGVLSLQLHRTTAQASRSAQRSEVIWDQTLADLPYSS